MRITHTSTVTDDQIDHLGHMNVRFYGVNARQGTGELLSALGADRAGVHLAMAYTRHHREQLAGADLVVRSGVIDARADRLRLYHELANPVREELAATFVHDVVPAEPRDRLDDDAVEAAAAAAIRVPEHGRPRSLSWDVDPTVDPPPIDVLRDRGLAVRRPRAVGADECDSGGVVPPENVAMLLWGGERIDGSDAELMFHDAPSGQRMGWAVMETRTSTRRLALAGDRIQSFGAVAEVRAKTSRSVHWVYDLDAGEVVVATETVNLAFDTGTRRSMEIPDEVRAREEAQCHPDLTN